MKILWGIYVVIGLGAFAISYLLEGFVFSKVSDMFLLSFAFAAVFESAKIMTIIMHRFLTEKSRKNIPMYFKGITVIFRLTLVFLSIGCSVALLSTFLDKPNLNKIMLADKELIENNYQENKKSLRTELDKTLTNLEDEVETKYQNRYSRLAAYYEPRIEKEEKLRDFEFTNIINNVRKGPMWNEHDRKINLLTNAYQEEQKELQAEENKELKSRKKETEDKFFLQLNHLRLNREKSLVNLEKQSNNDPRVCNQMLLSLIGTMKKGLDIEIGYDSLTILFAIITALLLDGTIYIVFNYLTITHQEIFCMRQDQYIAIEKIKANAKTEMDKDNVKYGLFKNRVKNQVRNVKANAFAFNKNVEND